MMRLTSTCCALVLAVLQQEATEQLASGGNCATAEGAAELETRTEVAEGWDDCHTALPGEDCHRHVTWAMTRGIHTETAAEDYPGLTKDSSFREFQHLLHHFVPTCAEPCWGWEDLECHTAEPGEECYGHVSWAMQTGLYEHPELYEGLTEHSLFEDFQDYIRDVHPSCAEPCPPDLVPPLEGDTPGRGAPLHEFADLSDARPGTPARPQDQAGLDALEEKPAKRWPKRKKAALIAAGLLAGTAAGKFGVDALHSAGVETWHPEVPAAVASGIGQLRDTLLAPLRKSGVPETHPPRWTEGHDLSKDAEDVAQPEDTDVDTADADAADAEAAELAEEVDEEEGGEEFEPTAEELRAWKALGAAHDRQQQEHPEDEFHVWDVDEDGNFSPSADKPAPGPAKEAELGWWGRRKAAQEAKALQAARKKADQLAQRKAEAEARKAAEEARKAQKQAEKDQRAAAAQAKRQAAEDAKAAKRQAAEDAKAAKKQAEQERRSGSSSPKAAAPPPPPDAAAAAEAKRAKMEAAIVTMYKELGFPEKAAEVPALLEKYAGRERLLMQKLHHKYGVNPVAAMEKEERAAAKAAKVEKTLQRVYAEVNPAKVGEVLRLLKKFAGRERELLDKVCKKYDRDASAELEKTSRLAKEAESSSAVKEEAPAEDDGYDPYMDLFMEFNEPW